MQSSSWTPLRTFLDSTLSCSTLLLSPQSYCPTGLLSPRSCCYRVVPVNCASAFLTSTNYKTRFSHETVPLSVFLIESTSSIVNRLNSPERYRSYSRSGWYNIAIRSLSSSFQIGHWHPPVPLKVPGKVIIILDALSSCQSNEEPCL